MKQAKPIIILSDSVFSIPKSKVSLLALIKHNCESIHNYTFRFLNSNSIDNLLIGLSQRLGEFKNLTSNNLNGLCYVLCGLNECTEGYNVPIFETHIKSLILELDNIGYDTVFINCVITNGLPGKIGGWFRRSSDVIDYCCSTFHAEQLRPKIPLKVENAMAILPIESTRIIVKSICNDIEQRGL